MVLQNAYFVQLPRNTQIDKMEDYANRMIISVIRIDMLVCIWKRNPNQQSIITFHSSNFLIYVKFELGNIDLCLKFVNADFRSITYAVHLNYLNNVRCLNVFWNNFCIFTRIHGDTLVSRWNLQVEFVVCTLYRAVSLDPTFDVATYLEDIARQLKKCRDTI